MITGLAIIMRIFMSRGLRSILDSAEFIKLRVLNEVLDEVKRRESNGLVVDLLSDHHFLIGRKRAKFRMTLLVLLSQLVK